MLNVTLVVPIAPQGKKTPTPIILGARVSVAGVRAVLNPKPRAKKDTATERYESDLTEAFRARWPDGTPPPNSPCLAADFLHVRARPKRRPARIPREAWNDGLVPCPAKPDWDNEVKSTQDALYVLLRDLYGVDDGSVVMGRAVDAYAEKDGHPRVCVRIYEVHASEGWLPVWAVRLAEHDPLFGEWTTI